ncbi:glutamate synthase-related protein [Murimonas intestini]|uniref:Glutamate synthase-like protein n=1 Tax=Murimonas intestini TaxID=1337051 RepID=A0AB73T125_9FIRM|nr:glutamate synthase-related protein [Murimonas intestini]MCR1840454.1 glutamate synthase-related protein [Murimonas intestini]MCR1867435.1 glutamate synthase-related protein [Murimonas intestini]MCR1884622.1 glutamate synthase-related protein [Murimonas intestini]
MAKYKCSVCGFIFDEEKEGKSFETLTNCPVCGHPSSMFERIRETGEDSGKGVQGAEPGHDGVNPETVETVKAETLQDTGRDALAYDPAYVRHDPSCRYMEDIHEMALTGKTIIAAMGTKMPMPGWDDILILGAQLNPPPLDEHAQVNIRTVIGKNALKPMVLEAPVYISHMSFGALSKEVKVALARGTAMAGTAMCSGEGGILPEEMEAADKYIFEYVPNLYSVTPENLQKADAVEIKIGQGTKPGMGGHLPGDKVTPEIARIRNKPLGQDVISPSKFHDINTKEDLRDLVEQLRYASEGRPIGIKIAAGKIEKDLEYCIFAKPDFITIDGRGGATGASPKLLRDATSVPAVYALSRARKYLDEHGADIDLVITGGLRVSSDIAKAIAMGADAVAVATAGLMAAACQQYRICGSGKCPVGIATQDETLRARLKGDAAAQRVANFLNCTKRELETFARITGHRDIHDLSVEDLCTISREISEFTDISHA